jgi:hypothetical protein
MLPSVEILGRYDLGLRSPVTIARHMGIIYPLTSCCEASAKGAEEGIICRSCYRPVSDVFGLGWTQEEWDTAPLGSQV